MLASTFRESGERRVGLEVQRWRGERREAGGAGGPCRTLPVLPPGGNRRGWQGTPKSKRPTAQFPGGPSAASQLLGDAGGWRARGGGAVTFERLGRLHEGAAALPGSVPGSLLPTTQPRHVQMHCHNYCVPSYWRAGSPNAMPRFQRTWEPRVHSSF